MNIGKKLFSLAALLALTACGPDYERTDITGVKASPLGGTVKANFVSVPEGMIVKARVVPYNDDGEPMQAHVVARDPSILEVTAVVNDRDYAFIGLRPGRTQVEFHADRDIVFVVEAEVTAQPPPETILAD